MAKPRLEKVRALFYVFQQVIKKGCAYFDTAPCVMPYVLRWEKICEAMVSMGSCDSSVSK